MAVNVWACFRIQCFLAFLLFANSFFVSSVRGFEISGILFDEVFDDFHRPQKCAQLPDCRRSFGVCDGLNPIFSDSNTFAGHFISDVLHPLGSKVGFRGSECEPSFHGSVKRVFEKSFVVGLRLGAQHEIIHVREKAPVCPKVAEVAVASLEVVHGVLEILKGNLWKTYSPL